MGEVIRNDYIMRQIELLGAFVARLLKRVEAGELEQAATDADAAARQFTGVPLLVLENQPPDGFEEVLSAGGPFDYMRGLAAATLLEVRGRLAQAGGDEPTAFRLWTLAAALLLRCHESPDVQVREMCASRLEDVLTALQEYEVPVFLHRLLAIHHERREDYSRAENHVFLALEAAMEDAGALPWARAFYQRLEALTDAQLQAGDFSRTEVCDGIAELERIARGTRS